MITKMTGVLNRILDDEARLEVGPFEYQVLLPEAVRRQLQFRTGEELTLHICEYLEGNQSISRFTPRKLGFLTEQELEFFELFCTVDKIGPKKALKAMARPVREMADAINRGDTAWLTTLPGIGGTTAEQIVLALKKKITPFLVSRNEPEPTASVSEASEPVKKTGKKKPAPQPVEVVPMPASNVVDDAYEALMAMGMSPLEARAKVDSLLSSRQQFTTVDEAIALMFRTKR
jgi:holliday junction DNA helicase RuvA